MQSLLTGAPASIGRRAIVSALLAMLLATGCKPSPQVSTYEAEAEPTEPIAPDEPEDPKSGERILGLIVPLAGGGAESQGWWFFKLQGRPKAVGARLAALEQMARTLQVPAGDGVPEFTLPKGWKRQAGKNQFVTMSIQTGHRHTPHRMTLSQAGGSLADNVNRWRGQVGLDKLSDDEVKKTLKEVKDALGRPVYLVDITGPGGGDNRMVPPFMKQ